MVTSLSTGRPGADAIQHTRSATTAGSSDSRSSRSGCSAGLSSEGSNVPQPVFMAPGYSTHTRIPSARPSAASDCVSPDMANLDEQ